MVGGGRWREVKRYKDRIRIHMYYYMHVYNGKVGRRQIGKRIKQKDRRKKGPQKKMSYNKILGFHPKGLSRADVKRGAFIRI
jgi:hypothetical protein